jgi:transcriptional regulator of arginine metabolism
VTDKEARQSLLRRLLSEGVLLSSQRDVQELLIEHGIETTQATISRDLDEIGAVKVRGLNGAHVYQLPAEPGPGAARERLDAILVQFVTSIGASGNIVALRTPPAGAHPVASVIDLSQLPGVLATVAGDDTVLVVASEGVTGAELAKRFRERLRVA